MAQLGVVDADRRKAAVLHHRVRTGVDGNLKIDADLCQHRHCLGDGVVDGDIDGVHLLRQRLRRLLQLRNLADGHQLGLISHLFGRFHRLLGGHLRIDLRGGVHKANFVNLGGQLLAELHHLIDRNRIGGAGHVAVRVLGVSQELSLDRVGHRRKEDGDFAGTGRRGLRGRGRNRHNHVHPIPHKFLADGAEVGLLTLGVLNVVVHLVLAVAQLLHLLQKRFADGVQRGVLHNLHNPHLQFFACGSGRAICARAATHCSHQQSCQQNTD